MGAADIQDNPTQHHPNIYQNFVPISLLAVVIPVAVFGISAYFSTENNAEQIAVIRAENNKLDDRIYEKLTRMDDKIDRLSMILERTAVRVDAMGSELAELNNEKRKSP